MRQVPRAERCFVLRTADVYKRQGLGVRGRVQMYGRGKTRAAPLPVGSQRGISTLSLIHILHHVVVVRVDAEELQHDLQELEHQNADQNAADGADTCLLYTSRCV